MSAIKIVVWDRVGNVMWGVRPWEEWSLHAQALLLRENPRGRADAPSFAELFAEYDVELCHVQNVEELAAQIGDADFLVVHKHDVPPEVLQRGGRLRLIQHLGQDYRGIPLATAQAMGVPVAATPLLNYLVVAEHSWALILSFAKRMAAQRRYIESRDYRAHGWFMLPDVLILRDQTLGLLGFGEIARPMATIARAFGMAVVYWDIVRFPELEARYGVEYLPWDELFAHADIVSMHLALNEQTEKIVGAAEFGRMKPTACFVNTARGKLVDQAALVEALRTRRIRGAALDVFEEEPLPADSPLHTLHEDLSYCVTLTAHTAWQGHWTHIRDSLEIWHNVLRVLAGEPVHHLVSS